MAVGAEPTRGPGTPAAHCASPPSVPVVCLFWTPHATEPCSSRSFVSASGLHCVPLHTGVRAHPRVHIRTPAHPHTCAPAHMHTLTPAHPHTCTPSHLRSRTPAHPHTCTRAHLHTCSPAHRHTRTRAHLHTLTPAHPHTCVDVPPFPSLTHTPASEARRRVAAPFASNGASGVSGCVVRDAAVTVSVWLCVPSPWKTPGSGIAGSRGHSVRDRHSGPQRQGAGLQLLTPLPPPAGAGAGRPAGPGEVLHFRFRFHSLVTDGARRLPLWPLGFVHLPCGKVHLDLSPVLKFGRLFSMSSTVLQLF